MSRKALILLLSLVSPALAADPEKPDSQLTPGDVLTIDAATVCRHGYTATVRHVTRATERAVFAAYGIPWARRSEFEVDHLISLELGGSNDAKNLWPEAYAGPEGARIKDQVEDGLHRLVCSGRLALPEAQAAIAADWEAARARYLLPAIAQH